MKKMYVYYNTHWRQPRSWYSSLQNVREYRIETSHVVSIRTRV